MVVNVEVPRCSTIAGAGCGCGARPHDGCARPGSGAAAAGHTYHVEAVPNPAGASNSALFGISCPMVAGCIAVGYATTSPKSAALVDTYTGGTWTPTALHQGFAFPGLEAVWCASMTSCVAVGDVGSLGANGAQPLAETLTDGTWTPTSPPLPETGITGSLDAISCVTTESCVAGGFFMDSEDNTYGLLEALSNGTWTPEVGPTPSQSTQSGIRSVRVSRPPRVTRWASTAFRRRTACSRRSRGTSGRRRLSEARAS